MNTPNDPIVLTRSQVEALNKQLSTMRHAINNHLSLVMAAVELVRRKPEAVERMSGTLTEQPDKIAEAMKRFSAEFETALDIRSPRAV
ncbi:MAG TPA: hypothetical protein PKN95_05320 [Verrucomicrobiota bacterium]|nr:hypothetical protein [Verrucomicrobiota bacterium]HNT13507.1 hypothetical protein [Verrucomicrobiota bacterium]